MSNVSQTASVHLAYQGSAFNALLSGINPQSTPYGTSLYLSANPVNLNLGYIGNVPDLVAHLSSNGLISTDVDFGNISYGNPFPASWQPFVRAYHYCADDLSPSPGQHRANSWCMESYTLPSRRPRVPPIAPLVGAVTSPAINGQNFFRRPSGCGHDADL